MTVRTWLVLFACGIAASQAAIAAQPTITTIAGGRTEAGIGDGGPATSARLVTPVAVAVDTAGNLYIAEGTDTETPCRVRKVDLSGTITTFAGNGTTQGSGENVRATSVSVCPSSLAFDALGNLYVGQRSRVSKVTPSGYISTVAGTGAFGFSGDGGPAIQATFGAVRDVAIDSLGQLYIADSNERIRKVDRLGVIRTIAGNGESHSSGNDGPATAAGMSPRAVVVDAGGNIIFIDGSTDTLRRISANGTVTRIAGNGPFRSDPLAINVDAYFPTGVALDRDGNTYFSNYANIAHIISTAGIIKVIAGVYNDTTFEYGAGWGFGGDGGPATLAVLNRPMDIAVDRTGNVFIADTQNQRVRKITPVQAPPAPKGVNAFLPVVKFPVGRYTETLALGDFNGDRRTDVVVATGSWGATDPDPVTDYRLNVFYQQPGGTLAAPARLAFPESRYVGDLVAADFNRDGYSDVALATERGISTYLGGVAGLRAGSLWRGEPNAEVPAEVIAGDIDLDGRPDLVAWTGGQSEGGTSPYDQRGVTIFYGDGLGGSNRKRFMPLEFYGGSFAWGDINRDGRADLLMTWAGSDNQDSGVAVFLHDGVDGFRQPLITSIGEPGFVGGIATGDFDGDGLLDVIVAKPRNAPDAAQARLRQTAQGTLAFVSSWQTYDIPSEMAGRDMDGDGDDDLLTLHSGWSSVGYRSQAPTLGASWLDTEVKYQIQHSGQGKPFAVGDLNGDRCLDVAVGDYNHGLQILYGSSCRKPPHHDFDGDGKSDILWRNGATGANDIWLSGNHLTQQSVTGVNNLAWEVAGTGDFNGDSRSDMLWRNRKTGANAIWLSGNHLTQQPITAVSNRAWQIAGVGDFDNDERSDILWRNATTGANAIWLSGSHTKQQSISGVNNLAWRVAGVGDFNNDRRSDILWRNGFTGANAIWLSGSNLTQQPVTRVNNLAWHISGVGDFDNDGRSDILWRSATSGANAIWWSGNYLTQPLVTGVTDLGWRIAGTDDLNDDGRSDILWRHAPTGANTIWFSGNHATRRSIAGVTNQAWRIIR